jgi:hypothetical protein
MHRKISLPKKWRPKLLKLKNLAKKIRKNKKAAHRVLKIYSTEGQLLLEQHGYSNFI